MTIRNPKDEIIDRTKCTLISQSVLNLSPAPLNQLTSYMSDDGPDEFIIEIANENHTGFAAQISATMEESARLRGTGIAKRSPETITKYMLAGKAIVAVSTDGRWVGFCYMSIWDNGKYVSNSGLIVDPEFRGQGVAGQLKAKLFELSRKQYPNAIIIGITTGEAVMKINSALGFQPTSFAQLPKDDTFWDGCKSCVNRDILQRTSRKYCLCTAMRFDPTIQKEIADHSRLGLSEEFH
jgi:GNAT superfamily N-acetyltransferase